MTYSEPRSFGPFAWCVTIAPSEVHPSRAQGSRLAIVRNHPLDDFVEIDGKRLKAVDARAYRRPVMRSDVSGCAVEACGQERCAGRFVGLHLIISPDGKITNATMYFNLKNEKILKKVHACVDAHLWNVEFPRTEHGAVVERSLPASEM
jgi:hypothetical protein